MVRAARVPVIVLVADNKAAEALEPELRRLRADRSHRSGAGGAPARHDVLPLKISRRTRRAGAAAPPRCGSSRPARSRF